MTPWAYHDMYQHKGVYYFIWCLDTWNGPIYNCTLEREQPPTTEAGYASVKALLKAKFGI